MANHSTQQVLHALDRDGDGAIGWTELVAAILSFKISLDHKELISDRNESNAGLTSPNFFLPDLATFLKFFSG